MRILFFLRDLRIGGAERQFLQTMGGLSERGHEVLLATRTPGGRLSPLLPPKVRHHVLFPKPQGRTGRAFELARTPGRLRRLVQELAPDVVYTALYVNDALAHRALAKSDVPLVWGFRNAAQPLSRLRSMALTYTRRHASEVELAVFNCHSGRDYLLAQGFRFEATRVIPNGIDVDVFRPAPQEGRAFRQRFGLAADAVVIGCVGRLHPLKDHPRLLEAAASFREHEPRARFVCVGAGDPAYEAELRATADRLGLTQDVVWTGSLDELRGAYNAFDLLASASLGEGFPNAVAEALACGTPCVVTDVGDCALVVEDERAIVRADGPHALAEAWQRLLALSPAERAALGEASRQRLREDFSLEACTRNTEDALASVCVSV